MSPEGETVTLRLKKTHLFGIGGFATGVVTGLAVAALFLNGPSAENAAAGGGPEVAQAPPPGPRAAVSVVEVSTRDRPFMGDEDAPVTIVEFTDYQCGFCARHHNQTLAPLMSQNRGKVRYVVRNFPLSSIHPLAPKAAEAAECALDQGRFWDYEGRLFNNQMELGLDRLVGIARELGMDVAQFSACLESGQKASVVEKDLQEGRSYGVRSTPTFFVNGRQLVGAKPLGDFQALIDQAMSEALAERE